MTEMVNVIFINEEKNVFFLSKSNLGQAVTVT